MNIYLKNVLNLTMKIGNLSNLVLNWQVFIYLKL